MHDLRPGEILPALRRRTRAALQCGALHSIRTEQRWIADAGVRFLVRSVSNLRRKAQDGARRRAAETAKGEDFNPFLPPEPELTVGALGPEHIAVLNKFNVLEQHLLIVTRRFEPQDSLLSPADFDALGRCLREIDGLGFYNGGKAAGASQRHKHLQLVPLPLAADGPDLPMQPLLQCRQSAGRICRLDGLPFHHAFCRLASDFWSDPDSGTHCHSLYSAMLGACAIPGTLQEGQPWQSAPYNLLIRRGWMLLVPRSREHAGRISINALGYAGSLFVRDAAELDSVARLGPMRILAEVSIRDHASA